MLIATILRTVHGLRANSAFLRIQIYDTEPFFSFHHANAFEDGSEVKTSRTLYCVNIYLRHFGIAQQFMRGFDMRMRFRSVLDRDGTVSSPSTYLSSQHGVGALLIQRDFRVSSDFRGLLFLGRRGKGTVRWACCCGAGGHRHRVLGHCQLQHEHRHRGREELQVLHCRHQTCSLCFCSHPPATSCTKTAHPVIRSVVVF